MRKLNQLCYNTIESLRRTDMAEQEQKLVYSSKINKIRSFALILVFVGIAIMYGGLLAKKIEWLMLTLFIIGVLFILLSAVVYFWIGIFSIKAIPIVFRTCERQTKIMSGVDACRCEQ